MPNKKDLCKGSGNECSILKKYLHPVQAVNLKYLQASDGTQLSFTLIRSDKINVTRCMQEVYVLKDEDTEFHMVQRWVRIDQESPEKGLFPSSLPTEVSVTSKRGPRKNDDSLCKDDEVVLPMVEDEVPQEF